MSSTPDVQFGKFAFNKRSSLLWIKSLNCDSSQLMLTIVTNNGNCGKLAHLFRSCSTLVAWLFPSAVLLFVEKNVIFCSPRNNISSTVLFIQFGRKRTLNKQLKHQTDKWVENFRLTPGIESTMKRRETKRYNPSFGTQIKEICSDACDFLPTVNSVNTFELSFQPECFM